MHQPPPIHLRLNTRLVFCLILTIGLLATLAYTLPGLLEHNTRYDEQIDQRLEQLQQRNDVPVEVKRDLRQEITAISEARAVESRGQLIVVLVLICGVIVVASLLQWVVGRSIVQPLLKLHQTVRQLESGDYSARAKLKTGDEIESLANAFDRLAGNIEQNREELQQKNRRLSEQQESLREMNEQLEQRVDAQTEKLQDTLQKEEAERTKLEKIIARMPDGLILLNERGSIIRANTAALEILGHRKMESIQNWIDQTPGAFAFRRVDHETIAWEEFPFNRAFRGEGFSNQVLYVRRPDNSTRLVSFSGGGVLGQGLGGTQLSVCIFRDVTEELALRTELEEKNLQLNEAAKAKDEFLAQLSHELRTPLTPIVTSAQLLQMEDKFDEEDRRDLQVIERNALALSRMIDELLSLSAIMNAKLRLQREMTELNALLRDVIAGVKPAMERKGQSCRLEPLDAELKLNLDPGRITQVLTNLLNNAVKYSDEGGRFVVRLRLDREEVRIAVQDDGVGMNQRELNEIFGMFHQTRAAVSRGASGLGIGLSIAKSLAELHSGRIEAESDGPGKGSTFTLVLPLKPNQIESATSNDVPKKASQREQDRRLLRGRRVLLIEDSADTIDALARILGRRECQVSKASSGAEAIRVAQREHPDIILSDLGLPDMDGLELIRKLRADGNEDAVAVSLSGRGREEDVRHALSAGFDAHLVKPVDIAELDSCLARALNQRSNGHKLPVDA